MSSRLAGFGRALLRQTVTDPVAQGRLRDDGWPYGLRAVVIASYAVFGLAGLLVVVSGAIRANSPLIITGTSVIGLPAVAVWPMVVLLSFGLALLAVATRLGPWWLTLLGLLLTLLAMGSWSLRTTDSYGWLAVAVVVLVGQLVLVLVRWRRRFAWWELAVSWGLVGASMTVGVVQSRTGQRFGFDLNPLLLQQTTATLGNLALPAALVAGAAVAEVTVRAAASATQSAQRLLAPRWLYLLLAVLATARLGQVGYQFWTRDRVAQDQTSFATAAVLLAAFAVLGWGVLRASRSRGVVPQVLELSNDLSRVSFVIAAVLVGLNLPFLIVIALVQVAISLDPQRRLAAASAALLPSNSDLVDPQRVLLGLVLVVLAVRSARRALPGRALVLGCVGIMLVALGRALFFGDSVRINIDPDALNLATSALVGVVVLVTAVRRTLTVRRAAAVIGVLVLSALFSYRDFISDPVGLLLGFSGAALVLFGLTWDLFTGSQWGNGDSRRFPRPARVLLVLTNAVLTMVVLSYAALIRDGSTTIYLSLFAELGDLVFGTALLAAAVITVLAAAAEDRPVS